MECLYVWLCKVLYRPYLKSILYTKVLKFTEKGYFIYLVSILISKQSSFQNASHCGSATVVYYIDGCSDFEVKFYKYFINYLLLYNTRLEEEKGKIIVADSSSCNSCNAWDGESEIWLTQLPNSFGSKLDSSLILVFSWAYETSEGTPHCSYLEKEWKQVHLPLYFLISEIVWI